MTQATDQSSERRALVYRYHERLYRLALLTAGSADTAGMLLQRAFRELTAAWGEQGVRDPETLLARALLPAKPPRQRWRWKAVDGDLTRSMLDRASADGLLQILARLAPAERLALGLIYLGGCTPDEVELQLGRLPGDATLLDLLARFRAGAARALGLAPADADENLLARIDRWLDGRLPEEDAIALRRAALEQPAARELRDGMIATRELLPSALPALFAVAPPPALTERLLKIVQVRQRPAAHYPRARWAQAMLALGVLALSAAIILLPSLAGRGGVTAQAQPPSAAELIDRAIHRFDRAPLQSGVLHEQYAVERGEATYLIERWYDYATPNRLAIGVKREGRSRMLMQVSSDGRSLVQFRDFLDGPNGARSFDV
ncbi:MAG TPA: hypothetical protein VFO07_02530, partial [Roseiflexaceae bacterium]|nr:hypothetical protein [Roseiflexaceae bacterium]